MCVLMTEHEDLGAQRRGTRVGGERLPMSASVNASSSNRPALGCLFSCSSHRNLSAEGSACDRPKRPLTYISILTLCIVCFCCWARLVWLSGYKDQFTLTVLNWCRGLTEQLTDNYQPGSPDLIEVPLSLWPGAVVNRFYRQ